MANPEHEEILAKGGEAWNEWRKNNPDIKPDLSRTVLAAEDLLEIQLSHTNLSGTDFIGTRRAPVERRHISGDLRYADLSGANLSGAFIRADFSKAQLVRADLSDADLGTSRLTNTNLKFANLSRADLRYVDLDGALLHRADMSEANLEGARGVVLDANLIRGAKFSAFANDPWSVLRQDYTGTRLFFHLLLLVAFFVPYVFRTMGWVSVNRSQEAIADATKTIAESAARLGKNQQVPPEIIDAAVERLKSMKPCLSADCKTFPVWKLLIGADRPFVFWALTLCVILYNFCRWILTRYVGALHDEEERSGRAPAWWLDPETVSRLNFLYTHGPGKTAEHRLRPSNESIRERIALAREAIAAIASSYRWLYWLHRAAQLLFVFAVIGFISHALDWLTRPVWLPK
ncbi:MAG: pentapeptide repeat-containing protein [Bryobacteraceae bacterium]